MFDRAKLILAIFPFPGESATHYLVKNTVRTFKELGVSAPIRLKRHHSQATTVATLAFNVAVNFFPLGPEGATREPGDHTGAEQHLYTSGQSQQTPAVHLGLHPAVTRTPLAPARTPGSFQ